MKWFRYDPEIFVDSPPLPTSEEFERYERTLEVVDRAWATHGSWSVEEKGRRISMVRTNLVINFLLVSNGGESCESTSVDPAELLQLGPVGLLAKKEGKVYFWDQQSRDFAPHAVAWARSLDELEDSIIYEIEFPWHPGRVTGTKAAASAIAASGIAQLKGMHRSGDETFAIERAREFLRGLVIGGSGTFRVTGTEFGKGWNPRGHLTGKVGVKRIA